MPNHTGTLQTETLDAEVGVRTDGYRGTRERISEIGSQKYDSGNIKGIGLHVTRRIARLEDITLPGVHILGSMEDICNMCALQGLIILPVCKKRKNVEEPMFNNI